MEMNAERCGSHSLLLLGLLAIINAMRPIKHGTMTELLRESLRQSKSLREIERATGVKHQSISKFLRGETSLRLDLADRLAAYFQIECTQLPRKGEQ